MVVDAKKISSVIYLRDTQTTVREDPMVIAAIGRADFSVIFQHMGVVFRP